MNYKTLLKLDYGYTEDMLIRLIYNSAKYADFLSLNEIFEFEYKMLKAEDEKHGIWIINSIYR